MEISTIIWNAVNSTFTWNLQFSVRGEVCHLKTLSENQYLPIDAKKRQEKKSRKGSTSSLTYRKRTTKMEWIAQWQPTPCHQQLASSQCCIYGKMSLLSTTLLTLIYRQHKPSTSLEIELTLHITPPPPNRGCGLSARTSAYHVVNLHKVTLFSEHFTFCV